MKYLGSKLYYLKPEKKNNNNNKKQNKTKTQTKANHA